MPWGLTRFQQTGQSHFVTFCCYHRRRLFTTDASRRVFESALERVRRSFRLLLLLAGESYGGVRNCNNNRRNKMRLWGVAQSDKFRFKCPLTLRRRLPTWEHAWVL